MIFHSFDQDLLSIFFGISLLLFGVLWTIGTHTKFKWSYKIGIFTNIWVQLRSARLWRIIVLLWSETLPPPLHRNTWPILGLKFFITYHPVIWILIIHRHIIPYGFLLCLRHILRSLDMPSHVFHELFPIVLRVINVSPVGVGDLIIRNEFIIGPGQIQALLIFQLIDVVGILRPQLLVCHLTVFLRELGAILIGIISMIRLLLGVSSIIILLLIIIVEITFGIAPKRIQSIVISSILIALKSVILLLIAKRSFNSLIWMMESWRLLRRPIQNIWLFEHVFFLFLGLKALPIDPPSILNTLGFVM